MDKGAPGSGTPREHPLTPGTPAGPFPPDSPRRADSPRRPDSPRKDSPRRELSPREALAEDRRWYSPRDIEKQAAEAAEEQAGRPRSPRPAEEQGAKHPSPRGSSGPEHPRPSKLRQSFLKAKGSARSFWSGSGTFERKSVLDAVNARARAAISGSVFEARQKRNERRFQVKHTAEMAAVHATRDGASEAKELTELRGWAKFDLFFGIFVVGNAITIGIDAGREAVKRDKGGRHAITIGIDAGREAVKRDKGGRHAITSGINAGREAVKRDKGGRQQRKNGFVRK